MYQPPDGQPSEGTPFPGFGKEQQPTAPMSSPQFGPPSEPRPEKKPLYQRSWFIVVVVIAALAVVGSALGHKGDDTSTTAASRSTTSTSTSTSTSSAPSVAAQPSVVVSPAPAAVVAPSTVAPPVATQVVVDFAMPNFVGMDLQSAQNLVQANGVLLSLSHDLLGSRQQVLDSNWVVCDQNIPVGRRVTGDAEGRIDFGVVKRTESCP
jgi:hypothetical protein